jgi:histidinol-phosphate aminotransferase
MTAQPRRAMDGLPTYRPGKGRNQVEDAGATAVALAANENSGPPGPLVRAAIERAAAEGNRYPDHFAVGLRAAIGGWVGLDPDRIAVGCGSVGLLQQIWLSYVEAGDEVVFPWRSFEVYPIYSQITAARVETPPLTPGHAFDPGSLVAACTARTKLLVIANPNNPTGTALPLDQVRSIVTRVPDTTLVVLDEAYREFMDPDLGDPVPDLLAAHPNVLVLRTFSKAYALAGLRVGYALGAPEVVATLDKVLIPFAVNRLAQAAAMAAIDSPDEVRAYVEGVRSERTRVAGVLRAEGWDVPDPQANFVWIPLGDRTDEVCAQLQSHGVLTRPFSGEGIRVTTGTPDENDTFLAAFRKVARPADTTC